MSRADKCMSGESFNDYCFNYGADEDSRKAYRTWEACQTSANDADAVIDTGDAEKLGILFSELGL